MEADHIERKEDGTIIQTCTDDMNEYLMKYPNYVGYATDVGKITGGKKTGEEALTIFVSKKVDPIELVKSEIIPASLPKEIHKIHDHRMSTDVVEIGEVTAPPTITTEARATLDDYRYDYNRPFQGGVSVGNIKITAGTAAGTFIANGKKVLGTNTHVGCESIRTDLNEQDRRVLQPGPHDGGKETDQFGTLRKAIIMPEGKPAFNDFCYVEPENEDDLDPEIYEIGVPAGTTTIEVGDLVYKSGRTTGLSTGTILSTNATVNVGYNEGTVTHKACILTTDMSDGGDSGSLMVSYVDGVPYVWGYLFAGSDTTTVCHEIQNAMTALGITLYTEEPEDPDHFTLDFELEPIGEGMYTLRGKVENKLTELALPSATINLHGIVSMTTDSDGKYEIERLVAAVYTMTASKEGFTPQTKKVEITPDGQIFEVK